MKSSTTIAGSLVSAVALIYVAAVQVPAFLGSMSIVESYNECGDAVSAMTPEALMKNSTKATKDLQAACAGYHAKTEVASKVFNGISH